MNETDCIFCKIVKGEISKKFVYKDENFVAFLDIEPVSDGHLLIIPKKHIVWMQEAEDKIISDIFILTKKMMLAIKESFECDYVQVSVSGTDLPHFHVHLIPRYHNDGLSEWPTKTYKDEEEDELVKKITEAL